MKKLITFLLLATLFVGCSSDDVTPSTDIVGIWTWGYSTPIRVSTNNPRADQVIAANIRERDPEYRLFVFTTNGKVKLVRSIDNEEIYGTYSIADDIITISYDDLEGNPRLQTYRFQVYGPIFIIEQNWTAYYQREIPYLLPDVQNVVVSEVVFNSTYQRNQELPVDFE